MTSTEFFEAVERELRLRAVPFDQRDAREFVEAMWPLPLFDPRPARWAAEFLAEQQLRLVA